MVTSLLAVLPFHLGALSGPARVLFLASPLAGAAVVFSWRLRETRRPITTARIVAPPMGMSTGFGMFLLPAFRVPPLWALAAFALGTLVLAEPLLRTSRLERDGAHVRLRPSPAFLGILVALVAVRFALRAWVEQYVSPLQTAALIFVLAFGMIARWRATMLRDYRRLTAG